MIKLFISGSIIYLSLGLGLFLFQRKFTFNLSGKPKKPEDYNLKNVSIEYIKVSDSIKLLSWLSRPKRNKPIILYFHGNSFDIGERAFKIKKFIDKGYGVLIFAYRGFSGNKGKPNENNIYNDSKIIIKWLKKTLSIEENNIILYGESLGTGVAIEMAQKRNFRSVILEAPFTSITEIAKKMYPIYPVKFLIWDKFDNLSKINSIFSPILFIHGKKDEIVPFEMGERLYNSYKNKKENLFVDEAMHNNLYDFNIILKIIKFIEKY